MRRRGIPDWNQYTSGRFRCAPMYIVSYSAATDPELFGWLCRASTGGHVPSFVRALVEAAFRACTSDYQLLRPVLLELKGRHPEREHG